jgi:hypothetical protein
MFPFFVFFFVAKVVSLKVVYPLVCQNAKFYNPTLNDASFTFTSEV